MPVSGGFTSSRALAAQPSPRWPTEQIAASAICSSPSTTLHISMLSSVVMMHSPRGGAGMVNHRRDDCQ